MFPSFHTCIRYETGTINYVTISEFQVLQNIGYGNFSHTILLRHKNSGALKAAKVIKNNLPKMYHQYVETEKRVMAALDGIFPFIVGMHLLATDPDNTYLIMPLTPGGNLFDLVYERGSLGEYMARFYSAQVREIYFNHNSLRMKM